MRYTSLIIITTLTACHPQPGGETPSSATQVDSAALQTLVQPANRVVKADMPAIAMQRSAETIELEAVGRVDYDTRFIGSVSARVSGRIERLHVKYRYQQVKKGQPLMDVYSPELLTAQQNLLFLLDNDPGNTGMIEAARERLYQLGFTAKQTQQLAKDKKTVYAVTIYSPYNGHLHDTPGDMQPAEGMAASASLTTAPLSLKEGDYVQRGKPILTVYDPCKTWILLNIFPGDLPLTRVGDKVRIRPESAPDRDFRAQIDYLEPVLRQGNKVAVARVYFDNTGLQLPIGDRVRAIIFSRPAEGWWLPEDAVVALGSQAGVMKKNGDKYEAVAVQTGLRIHGKVQITGGLSPTDSVASNAQFLLDSDSFFTTK
ncbi:MAG: efflux RND transporter periplasmic adaptor subunit [Saprospiraceae bacterium]|jgi:Cu(I)/Ag(I) efflux system membrane fusion protein|nr:efflux RND transporter periplasmic adaptor subunit [Saprospiraceae bacterium]